MGSVLSVSASSDNSTLSDTADDTIYQSGIGVGHEEEEDRMAQKYRENKKRIRFKDPYFTKANIIRNSNTSTTSDIEQALSATKVIIKRRKSQAKFLTYLGMRDSHSADSNSDDFNSMNIASVMDEKLKHYFGWTVNASADDISISSDDSIAFWEEYNINLQIAMERKRTEVPESESSSFSSIFSLVKFSWPLLLLCTLTCFSIGAGTILFDYQGAVILEFHLLGKKKEVIDTCFATFYCITIPAVAAVLQEIIVIFGCYWMSNRMRVFLFHSFLKQPLGWFDFPENDISILCDILKSDVVSLQSAVFTMFTVTVQSVTMIGLVYYLLLRSTVFYPESIWLSLCLPVFIVINFADGRLTANYNTLFIQTLGKGPHIVFDMIANIRTIIIYHLEKQFLDAALRELVKSKITIGEIVRQSICCVGKAFSSFPTMREIKIFAGIIATAKKSLRRSKYLKSLKPFLLHKEDDPPNIHLQDVRFHYPLFPDAVIFKGITLDISSGQFVAIVGPSFCGKSTLINLLLNILPPTAGSIFLNETNYEDIEEGSIHKIIGCIEPDPVFMPHLTVAENITYGDLSRVVDTEEIEDAARLAKIHHVIENMENGYETKLEDLPETPETFVFRQRLEIARTFVHNPKILLVDDSTVSLDLLNTKLLLEAIMKLRIGRTFVVASRRIEPIRSADVIIVLRDGLIDEMGSDTELLESKGTYYELYMGQTLYETNEKHVKRQ